MVRVRLRLPEKGAIKVLKILVVFAFVSLTWLLFKLTDFRNVVDYIAAIWHNRQQAGFYDTKLFIFIYSVPVVGYHLSRYFRQYLGILDRTAVAACLYGLMLFLIATNGGAILIDRRTLALGGGYRKIAIVRTQGKSQPWEVCRRG
jgi:alginate O-acetyltransferase complex protein AlgI